MQCVIALVMLRRGLVGQFPFFFSYTVLLPARDAVLYFLHNPGNRYSSVYWWGEAVAVLLALGVVFETSSHFLRPYPFFRLFLRVLWISAVVAGAVALPCCFGPRVQRGRTVAFEWIILTGAFRPVPASVFADRGDCTYVSPGADLASLFCGNRRRFRRLCRPGPGFAGASCPPPRVTDAAFVLLRPAAYNLGVAIWAFYFLRPQGGKPVGGLPGTDLANWNNALTEHVNKWYRH